MGDWEAFLHFPHGCLSDRKRAHYHMCNQEEERDSHTDGSEPRESQAAFQLSPSFGRRSLGAVR